eukprot:gene11713-biopygen16885
MRWEERYRPRPPRARFSQSLTKSTVSGPRPTRARSASAVLPHLLGRRSKAPPFLAVAWEALLKSGGGGRTEPVPTGSDADPTVGLTVVREKWIGVGLCGVHWVVRGSCAGCIGWSAVATPSDSRVVRCDANAVPLPGRGLSLDPWTPPHGRVYRNSGKNAVPKAPPREQNGRGVLDMGKCGAAGAARDAQRRKMR